MPNSNSRWLQKNEAWVDEWQSMSFCFCCHHFFSERLTATLLLDDHYTPPNLPSTERTLVNVYKILKFFIPMVFVMRGISLFCLSFPCFWDSISKVSHLFGSALVHEFVRSSPQMLALAACNSSFRDTQRLTSRPSFWELDLHMRDERAALYYILQVSSALWTIFNPTIDWAKLLCLCPLFLNWKWWLKMLLWLMVNVLVGLAHFSCPMASIAPLNGEC